MRRLLLAAALTAAALTAAGCGEPAKPSPPQNGQEVNVKPKKGNQANNGPAVEKFETPPPPPK